MRNTVDVTGGKPIAVLLQSITGVSAINPLVGFYDIHGGKREVIFFYFLSWTPHETLRIQTFTNRNRMKIKVKHTNSKLNRFMSLINQSQYLKCNSRVADVLTEPFIVSTKFN
jgi:hypothetical protein